MIMNLTTPGAASHTNGQPMQNTPKGLRLHIGLFGRRNVGKSALLNALTRQQVSIVSPVAGTTTDPVEKPMELLPLGPVVFIDTAGVDDEGALGTLRVQKTRQAIDRTDLAMLVTEADCWTDYEERLLVELRDRKVPVVVCLSQCDRVRPDSTLLARLIEAKIPTAQCSAVTGSGLAEVREALLQAAPAELLAQPRILGDLVGPGGLAVLVVPIDKEAPKGRLILPQVQAIRDLLDTDAMCIVVKENGLRQALARLTEPPKLVVTDSQAFAQVAGDTPEDVPLTGFSILLSRFKGDLITQVLGACAVDTLKEGDRILVAESCCHHPIEDDIGRVKIPRWLNQRVGATLQFDHVQGHDFPEDLSAYRLVIHCGACTITRREVLTRIARCQAQQVPITNYGLVIAYSLGMFERALSPFPAALEAYQAHRCQTQQGTVAASSRHEGSGQGGAS
jgi:[FeFe] hydrogenase H-cluster maturation GTPase HydF